MTACASLVACPLWISSEFVNAARAQASALGATDYRTVVVAHPIQPLTREEVRLLADQAFDEILRRVTA
jgi:hypothetical protein